MAALIGVISDTHGLIREDALLQLRASDLIIHAGDVGKPAVLDALRGIAPVYAVRGNVDHGVWADQLPLSSTITVQQVRILVLHKLADLDFDPAARGFAAVISGHSHKAVQERRNGVLYLNPGAAGPRRFHLLVTMARLIVDADAGSVHAEIIRLDETPASPR